MRLNKKYPAAYTSGNRKINLLMKIKWNNLVIRMNSSQNNPLDEDDDTSDLTTSVVN
jgi:hypothetical protein